VLDCGFMLVVFRRLGFRFVLLFIWWFELVVWLSWVGCAYGFVLFVAWLCFGVLWFALFLFLVCFVVRCSDGCNSVEFVVFIY